MAKRTVLLLDGGLFLRPDASFLHVTPCTLSYETFEEEQVVHLSHFCDEEFRPLQHPATSIHVRGIVSRVVLSACLAELVVCHFVYVQSLSQWQGRLSEPGRVLWV